MRFASFAAQHGLFGPADKVLLAVSGGLDSMAMLRLFREAGVNFGVAHCNFSLRGEASDLDCELVRQTALMAGAAFHSATFNTRSYASKHKLSIQEAARELRYQWLEETAFEHHYSLIATGHHLDDSIETLFINLLRGTGVRGLAGIPVKNGKIIRPLWFATRSELEAFASQLQLAYRTDASNLTDKYLRNRLRHKLIPLLLEIDPGLHKNLRDFMERMRTSADWLATEVKKQAESILFQETNGFSIDTEKLLAHPQADLLLFEFLKDYGFSATVCQQLFNSLRGPSGRLFYSESHMAIKDRQKVFIAERQAKNLSDEYVINENTTQIDTGELCLCFDFLEANEQPVFGSDEQTAFLDFERLHFPLVLRRLQNGDRIKPLGMKGNKKISDLLIDLKTPRHMKESVWVLVSGSEIAWVAGIRLSENFKLRPETKKIFRVKIVNTKLR